MKIQSVYDETFSVYGRVLEGYDFSDLLKTLEEKTPRPENEVVYLPSEATLEALPVFEELQNRCYGGMPIQIGYCNGSNVKLNCLEYHRDSEVNIAAEDAILLLAPKSAIKNEQIHTDKVEAFLLPKGIAVQLYETALHYAPCNAMDNDGFRVIIVLPRGTNTEKPNIERGNSEDALLWARNKWLLAHPNSNEAKAGAHIGIDGPNIELK